MKKQTLLSLMVPLLVGGSITLSRYEQHLEKPEFTRLNTLAKQVVQKAIGDDNKFSLEEQAKFLRDIDYKGIIIEGEEIDFDIKRYSDLGFFRTTELGFSLKIGNKQYRVLQEIVEEYLRK